MHHWETNKYSVCELVTTLSFLIDNMADIKSDPKAEHKIHFKQQKKKKKTHHHGLF